MSSEWNRPAVGIVRVERQLERELAGLLGPRRLRRFVALDGKFKALPQPGQPGERSSPAPGDVILDVGLDWKTWGQGSTRHYEALRRKTGVRVVTCCHDVIPVLFPHYMLDRNAPARFSDYLKHLTRGSDVVLCISRRTELDYLAFCDEAALKAPRTAILPLGDDVPDAAGEVSERVRAIAQQRYILFVSTLEKRKNHEALYRACHLLARAGHRADIPRVVFVGMHSGGVEELAHDLGDDPAVKGLFVHLDRVNDAELNLLYRNAFFCAYPSLYEGWGLPVGEALSMGKFVLCSDRGSLPEVGGDLVRYLDPWHAQAWADAILEYARNPAEVARLEAQVRKRYTPRRWRDAAQVVAGLITAP